MLITQHQNRIARRAGFTLLEVLVVMAIIVILAGGASIYIFGYLEEAREDQARANIVQFEKACINYAAKNGTPPASLMELVAPTSGGRALIDGGANALLDPWNKEYQYDPNNTKQNGDPDPVVWTTTKEGKQIMNPNRRGQQ